MKHRFLIIAFVAALVGAPSVLANDSTTWEEPEQLAEEIPFSWFPEINADPTGAVRLTWTADLAMGLVHDEHVISSAVMVTSLEEDGWTAANDIRVMDRGINSRPIIASDGTYVHMVYLTASTAGGGTHLAYTRAAATAELGNVHSWSEDQRIASGTYYAQLTVLSDQSLVLLYNPAIEVPGSLIDAARPQLYRENQIFPSAALQAELRSALFSRRSTDYGRTWSSPVRISTSIERVSRSTLTKFPDGYTLLASWDHGYDNSSGQGEPHSVGTAVSKDGGATWQHVRVVESSDGAIEQAAVAVGRDGPLLVYRSVVRDELLFRTSEDDGYTWSEEQTIPDVTARPYPGKHNFDKLALATDGDGRIILVYVGKPRVASEHLAVMITTFADGEWTTPKVIASPAGFPEYPRLVVVGGNRLHLAYFVRDREWELGNYSVWTVQGQSDAKAIALQPAMPEPAQDASRATRNPLPIQLSTAPERPEPPQKLVQTTSIPSPNDTLSDPIVRAAGATAIVLLASVVLLGVRSAIRLVWR